jgi:hypothetical protein
MRCLASVVLFAALSPGAYGQQVAALVAPFDSSRAGGPQLGERSAMILNLQIWQTLRIPPTADGRKSTGMVLWVTFSDPPKSQAEAKRLASYVSDDPRIVLWGRAWHFGGGTVVEAFLLVRSKEDDPVLSNDIWHVTLSPHGTLAVGVPRAEVEFAPVVLRTDLLGDLEDPSGLKLYADRTRNEVKGTLGDAFRALEQADDMALVKLPNGDTGWVYLPSLSADRSEVVDFTAGLIRIFRHDWPGAIDMFTRVVNNSHTPTSVRVDAYLYLSLAADMVDQGSYQWAKKAYEANPYSKSVVQYLCMSRVSDFNRLDARDQRGERGLQLLRSLNEIAIGSSALFPPKDPWLKSVQEFVGARLH